MSEKEGGTMKPTESATPTRACAKEQETTAPLDRSSYASLVPITGINMLLVGPSHLCQPLGASLLAVRLDCRRKGKRRRDCSKDAAVEALRSTVLASQETSITKNRHVQMVEKLKPHVMESTRTGHVVLVITPKDVEYSKKCLEDASKYLDDDYTLMQRLSIVVMDGNQEVRNAQWESLMRSKKIKRPVTFPCQSKNKTSCLAVARMLLQRASVGSRMGESSVSPLLL